MKRKVTLCLIFTLTAAIILAPHKNKINAESNANNDLNEEILLELTSPDTNNAETSGESDAEDVSRKLDQKTAERSKLEKELEELERQIAEQESTVEKYRSEGKTLKNEIKYLDSRIKQLNLQIQAVNISINKLNDQIMETQKNINRTENKIDIHKDALSRAVRAIYENEQRGMIEILLANRQISDFFNAVNDITLVQSNLRTALENIVLLRQEMIDEKNELNLAKNDSENLRDAQAGQKNAVASTQAGKAQLLKITKGKESEYQKLLETTRLTAAQIRSRIFTLLGGGELTFEKAYEFAKVAEQATGVRAPFILAILNQESNFGKFVGNCKYDEVNSVTGVTVMNPKQIPAFLEILKELEIDQNTRAAYVSCPILRDGNHGGAMGPAQFIPSTWNLYKADVAAITGNKPPSPWNNADAFTATTLFLKDSLNSKSCQNYAEQNANVSSKQTLVERCAASQYYAGNRWHTYRWVYGEPVVTKANQFARDIEILNS